MSVNVSSGSKVGETWVLTHTHPLYPQNPALYPLLSPFQDIDKTPSFKSEKSSCPKNCLSAILGPEMAAPILWAPGKNAFFLQEKPDYIKFLLLGGGGVGGGGGSADFIFMGAGIFLTLTHLERGENCSLKRALRQA